MSSLVSAERIAAYEKHPSLQDGSILVEPVKAILKRNGLRLSDDDVRKICHEAQFAGVTFKAQLKRARELVFHRYVVEK